MDLGSLAQGTLVLLAPFLISAALKTAQGSSTTALCHHIDIRSSTILVIAGIGGAFQLALDVIAIGAGAMAVSHVNDSFFWGVTQYSGMEVT